MVVLVRVGVRFKFKIGFGNLAGTNNKNGALIPEYYSGNSGTASSPKMMTKGLAAQVRDRLDKELIKLNLTQVAKAQYTKPSTEVCGIKKVVGLKKTKRPTIKK